MAEYRDYHETDVNESAPAIPGSGSGGYTFESGAAAAVPVIREEIRSAMQIPVASQNRIASGKPEDHLRPAMPIPYKVYLGLSAEDPLALNF